MPTLDGGASLSWRRRAPRPHQFGQPPRQFWSEFEESTAPAPPGPCGCDAKTKPPGVRRIMSVDAAPLPPAHAAPQRETGAAWYGSPSIERDSPTIALPSLSSATRDFSLRAIAASRTTLPEEFLEAILAHGETDATNLTYRVFWHVNHPELSGRTLDARDPKQAALRAEWNRILNNQVAPLIWLRQVIDQLDRHRGAIPREFLLGWMAVESDGQVAASSSRGERGYFQVDFIGGEAKEQLGLSRAEFERLGTDRVFSIKEGVELAARYREHILTRFPSVLDGSELLLRLTKGRHAASTTLDKVLTAQISARRPLTWAALSTQLPGFLVTNVNGTMDFAAQLKRFPDLVPQSAATAPELEFARWESAAAQPYGRNASPFPAWRAAGDYRREAFTPTAPVPVVQLTYIQGGLKNAAFAPGPSGFDALFCGDLPSPQLSIAIAGKVVAEDSGGAQRSITAADLKKWQIKDIVNLVYTGQGVSASTSPVSQVRPDGSFKTESMVVLDPGTRRIRVRVALELKGGSSINAEALFERLDFECFLEYVDAYEKKRPIGRVDGKCQVAASHFEFLSSVRKMFQPAPGSSLTSLFDEFLHRNRKLCPLADVNSAQGKYLRSFENLQIGGDVVDIGHVLVGIEASRRQHPDPVFPSAVARDAHTESLMTWGGDLASALEAYAEAVFVDHKRANLQDYLNHLAGRADLLGDLDGLNLGAVYDESKTFAENLRKYYGVRPFRRFHDFLSSALDDSAKPLFKLIRQSPPVLDSAGRLEIASVVTYFCGGAVYKRRQAGKLNDAQSNQILAMCNRGTKEMDAVIDYFFKILLDGLAKEP